MSVCTGRRAPGLLFELQQQEQQRQFQMHTMCRDPWQTPTEAGARRAANAAKARFAAAAGGGSDHLALAAAFNGWAAAKQVRSQLSTRCLRCTGFSHFALRLLSKRHGQIG